MRTVLFKTLHLMAVLLVTTLIAFTSIRLLPGDPASAVLGEGATDEAVATLRHDLRLDEPLVSQYLHWLSDVLRFDLGQSARSGEQVLDVIIQRVPVSLELMIVAQILALALAIPMALLSAYRRDRSFDRLTGAAAFAAISIPDFVLGIVLILVFSLTVGWLPATGWTAWSDSPADHVRGLVLPGLVLGVTQAAIYQRILRNDVVSTLQEDFIATAKTKGLSMGHILLRHALRPSSFSLVTLAGINIGRLIGGAVVIEVLFALPGLGQLIVSSLSNRDYVMVQGAVLFVAVAYVLINALVDLLYLALDPRVKQKGRS